MTKYLIIFLAALLIYVPLSVASYYTKRRKGKSYELLNGSAQLTQIFVWLSIGNWILARFFDGGDSSTLLWIMACLIGLVLTSCIDALIRAICVRVWPADPEMVVRNMKMPQGLRLALDIFATLVTLGFVAFFCYGLAFHNDELSTSDMVIFVLVIILFTAGAIFNASNAVRGIRKMKRG